MLRFYLDNFKSSLFTHKLWRSVINMGYLYSVQNLVGVFERTRFDLQIHKVCGDVRFRVKIGDKKYLTCLGIDCKVVGHN